jgi:hypothetical protein
VPNPVIGIVPVIIAFTPVVVDRSVVVADSMVVAALKVVSPETTGSMVSITTSALVLVTVLYLVCASQTGGTIPDESATTGFV